VIIIWRHCYSFLKKRPAVINLFLNWIFFVQNYSLTALYTKNLSKQPSSWYTYCKQNIGIAYSEFRISWFSSVHINKCWNSTSICAKVTSCHILQNPSFGIILHTFQWTSPSSSLFYYSETSDIWYISLINYILSQSKHILLNYIKTFYYKNKNSSTLLSHVGSNQPP